MENTNYYYMVLNENMQDFENRQFKLNKQYSVKYNGYRDLAFEGFVAYKHIEHSIYDCPDSNSRFFLVKSTGEEYNVDNNAFFCSNITLIKEITRDMLEVMCDRKTESAILFICRHTNREDVLKKYIHSLNDSVRVAIAENPNTPLNLIKILAEDDSVKVLKALKETHNNIDIKEEIDKNLEIAIRDEEIIQMDTEFEYFKAILIIAIFIAIFSL